MPVALLEPLESPPRKRWTREECDKLDSMGFFTGQKFELIDGELISTMWKNSPHVIGLLLIHEWLVSVFGFRRVQQEASIDVAPEDNALNELEPDLVVLHQSRTIFTKNPKPEDVLLVVELSDTALSFDLSKKAILYARAGIPDYWVLDVNKRRLIVHREPVGATYSSVLAYRQNESVAPLAAPESPFSVAAAFEK